jgi:hypothetical protein
MRVLNKLPHMFPLNFLHSSSGVFVCIPEDDYKITYTFNGDQTLSRNLPAY